jgi:serine/threonine protein kinase
LPEDEKFSCDFWSLGVILFELLCGRRPFESQNVFVLIQMIKEGNFHMDDLVWDNISDSAKDFINGLLKMN